MRVKGCGPWSVPTDRLVSVCASMTNWPNAPSMPASPASVKGSRCCEMCDSRVHWCSGCHVLLLGHRDCPLYSCCGPCKIRRPLCHRTAAGRFKVCIVLGVCGLMCRNAASIHDRCGSHHSVYVWVRVTPSTLFALSDMVRARDTIDAFRTFRHGKGTWPSCTAHVLPDVEVDKGCHRLFLARFSEDETFLLAGEGRDRASCV